MAFDYEQTVWGAGEATLKWGDPAAFRLRESLRAIKGLSAGARVLEVGCGAGQFIRAVKKNRIDLECYGCDISVSGLERARAAGGKIEYSFIKDNALPYADGEFDAVLVYDVIEHAAAPEALLREIARVAKASGIFYCFVPCEGDWTSLWHLMRMPGWGGDLTRRYAGHINFFSRRAAVEKITAAGFVVTRRRYAEHFFGQILGVASFMLMDRRARRSGGGQINNEQYFGAIKKKSMFARGLAKIINTVVYLESAFLAPLPSPNLHLTCRKR